MQVDGNVAHGGLGGPAILPISISNMAKMTQACPEKAFSGIGGISNFGHALNYFLLGCGTVQVCTAAMLDHAVGTGVIKKLRAGMTEFLERNADKGWNDLEAFRGALRDRIKPHHEVRRPHDKEYAGGYETYEGYSAPEPEADPVNR